MDAPNVVIPFAGSYNVRGIAGYTNTITNALDQRRVNCIYQAVRNTFTNSTTLYLAKRPGVTDSGSTFGDSGQVAYLAGYGSGQSGSNVTSIWV